MNILRGDVVLANLEPVRGSEQGKTRPCLIVQNDTANKYSNTTIIVPITSKIPDREYPTTVFLEENSAGLKDAGTILCNQIRTISIESRIIRKIGRLQPEKMRKVDDAIKASLALT
ncbi:MAG: type II toxin-antitoxin system PemK/MazF family toxin [Candidatus Micrarchaeota archaeon]